MRGNIKCSRLILFILPTGSWWKLSTRGCRIRIRDRIFQCKIKLNGILWVGNIEIHERASDWQRHNHQTDKAYDSVILHVVSCTDSPTFRTDGKPIPQLEFHYPPQLSDNYNELLQTTHYPACYRLIPHLPPLMVHSFLSSLQTERFEQKTEQIYQRLNICNQNWEDAFFVTLARNFGFGVNNDAFELWAKTIPLQAVGKHRDSLFQIEAFFSDKPDYSKTRRGMNIQRNSSKNINF